MCHYYYNYRLLGNLTPQPTQPSCNGTAMSAYLINGSQIGFIIVTAVYSILLFAYSKFL